MREARRAKSRTGWVEVGFDGVRITSDADGERVLSWSEIERASTVTLADRTRVLRIGLVGSSAPLEVQFGSAIDVAGLVHRITTRGEGPSSSLWTPADVPLAPRRGAVAGAPPATDGTNGLAVASLVLGILWLYGLGSILAVIFGHVARGQIRERRGATGGDGLAVAGLVLGYIGVASLVLLFLLGAAIAGSS